MNTIVIIPARGGSKRFRNKNIVEFNGIPLIAHSICYAQECSAISKVVVSTDDTKIKDISLQYGASVIDRPLELAGDFEPTVSALKHVIENMEVKYEVVVLLQATNPLRPKMLLTEALKSFHEKQCDSLLTVTKNHHKLGRIVGNSFVPYTYTFGQRSQDLEPLYYENGLLYISKRELILADKIINENNFAFEIDHPYALVDIDTKDDLIYAEYILKHSTA